MIWKSRNYGQCAFGNTPKTKSIRMLDENESHYAVSYAEKHGKRPEYFGEVPNIFSLVTPEKSEKWKTCLQKPLWAKWLRMLGKNGDHHVNFHVEKHSKRPNALGKSQTWSSPSGGGGWGTRPPRFRIPGDVPHKSWFLREIFWNLQKV